MTDKIEKMENKNKEEIKIIESRLGKIEYTDNDITTFPKGLFGFEDLTKFLFIEDDREDIVFNYLQSVEEPQIVFVLVQPNLIIKDYQLLIQQEEIAFFYEKDNTLDFAIVTIPEDPKKSTVNLLGPIFINFDKGLGMQVLSENEKYTTKHLINEQLTGKLTLKKAI